MLLLGGIALRRQAIAIQPGGVITHFQTAIHKPTDDQRIDSVFLRLNAGRNFIFAVAFKDRNLRLQNNRAAVQFIGNKMDRGSVFFIAVFQRLTVRMQPRVFLAAGKGEY